MVLIENNRKHNKNSEPVLQLPATVCTADYQQTPRRLSKDPQLGLDQTGQDQTPLFAGQVLPDQTESGLIFSNILPTKYGLPIFIR